MPFFELHYLNRKQKAKTLTQRYIRKKIKKLEKPIYTKIPKIPMSMKGGKYEQWWRQRGYRGGYSPLVQEPLPLLSGKN